MAIYTENDDLVGLILASLETVSSHDLAALSLSLADESSLQLKRLWILLGSPSHSLSIISFLDGLSLRQRHLLLGRVTLRLIRRITDFLEDHTALKSGIRQDQNASNNEASVGDAPNDAAINARNDSATNNGELENEVLEAGGYGGRSDEDAGLVLRNGNKCRREDTETKVGRRLRIAMAEGSCKSTAARLGLQGSIATGEASDGEERKLVAVRSSGSGLKERGTSKDGCKIRSKDEERSRVLEKGVQEVAGKHHDSCRQGAHRVTVHEKEDSSPFSDLVHGRVHGVEPSKSTLMRSRRLAQEATNPTVVREAGREMLGRTSHGKPQGEVGLGVEDLENSRQSWGDTDAAFLLLFLSETQEQECLDALKKWCIDPLMYRHFIIRDMAALVDDESKSGLIRAPKWRESLQEYLLQNILQVGYGVPGMMSSANFPASLSSYVGTIGRFQRLLRNVNGDLSFEQRPCPPASAATLLSLPTIVIGSCRDEKGKLCSVCGEEFDSDTTASQLPCLHLYHWDCIHPWLKQRNTCPICRYELPTDDLDYELQRQKQVLLQRAA